MWSLKERLWDLSLRLAKRIPFETFHSIRIVAQTFFNYSAQVKMLWYSTNLYDKSTRLNKSLSLSLTFVNVFFVSIYFVFLQWASGMNWPLRFLRNTLNANQMVALISTTKYHLKFYFRSANFQSHFLVRKIYCY